MRRSLKIILPIAVLLVGVAIVGLMLKTRPQAKPVPREIVLPLVRVVRAKMEPHQFTVHAQGTVVPRTEINLVAEVAGRVVSISHAFAAGGFFEQGQELLTIDPRDYQLALSRAKATLAEAQVRLQREQAEAAVARKEWEALGTTNTAANSLLLRVPQIAEAQATVAAAEAALVQAEIDLERCHIRAPFAGRVWSKKVDAGQFLIKGEMIARIYAVDYAEVRLPLPLDQTGYLDLPIHYRGEAPATAGPRVTFRARMGGELHEWHGTIVRTEGEVDSRSLTLTAVARVEDPYGRSEKPNRPPLAVGLFVEATIMGRNAGEAILLPRSALIGNNQVRVVDSEQRLRMRTVEVLRSERDQIVIQRGLAAGELVTVSPMETAVEGMKVRVTEDAAVLPRNTGAL